MKTKYILLVLSLIIVSVATKAQEKKGNFDIEKFRKERAAFFTKELSLTDSEVKAFIPMMDEFMSKKFAINKESRQLIREIHKKTDKTDSEYKKVNETLLDAKIEEAKLQKEYYTKFAAVLSAKKVFKLHKVEMSFMKEALENHNRNHVRKK